MTPRSLVFTTILFAASALAGPLSSDGMVDADGVVFGIPFGAKEQVVTEKFGPPTGTIRLDDQRSALIYGRSFGFLFFEGQLDGVRMERDFFNYAFSNQIDRPPPFTYDQWTLSNGLREGMSLPEVAESLKIPLPQVDDGYNLLVPLAQTNLELYFGKFASGVFQLRSYLIARRHGDTDHWSRTTSKRANHPLKGKKVIGVGVTSTKKGIRVTTLLRGGPGDLAGLQYGDLIEKIDGRSTAGMSAVDFTRIVEGRDPHEFTIFPQDGRPSRVESLSKVDGVSLPGTFLGRSERLLAVSAGDEAPDFEASAADGRKIRLSELRGKLVLLNFTATWCAPGRMETPKLKSTYDAYRTRGFTIVSVYLDPLDKDPKVHAQPLGVTWPIQADGRQWENAIAQAYGVSAIPTNILIGPDGHILNTNTPIEILDQIIPRHLPQ